MFRYVIFTAIVFVSAHCSAAEETSPGSELCSPTMCYVVLEKLGEGAFGKVYKVQDENGVLRALKTLERTQSSSENTGSEGISFSKLLNDVKREYAVGKKLNHPNIVHSVDVWINEANEGDLSGFIVLDLVSGTTLNDIAKKTLAPEEVLQNCAAIVSALDYALSQDLLHLDLHWGNVMIDDQHRVMVIDLASFFSTLEVRDLIKTNAKRYFGDNTDIETWTVSRYEELEKRVQESITDGRYRYFFSVTAICVGLIQQSNMTPSQKAELQTDIERIRLRTKYEWEDGHVVPLEDCLAELQALLTDALTLQAA